MFADDLSIGHCGSHFWTGGCDNIPFTRLTIDECKFNLHHFTIQSDGIRYALWGSVEV
jgi:hypothetical protein